ncbi:uncharacterized protein LOC110966392 isoform X2 [Acanthochromis polyacanthus]|uniref:uncharacterized protein LOC110966392 isoform X2 n=1 Tax=Acanthochromis polyacanthus TaxID=80966 RepID=UPI002234084E|nr:uncharacterized protein LOC110966392 isoform X2 [Acanthochromis polyacanthus]
MERHITILLDGDTPTTTKSKCSSSEHFHCPFCKYEAAKHMVENHIKGHSSVKHREFTIIKCGLSCRTAAHFHCCYCAATIINRAQFLRHVEIHQEEEHAAAPKEQTKTLAVPPVQLPVASAHLPVAPTQLPVAPAHLPVAPAHLPVAPAQLPVAPTQLPVAPAQLPVAPTQLPVAPTQLPVAPTQLPLAPTQLPVAHAQHPDTPKASSHTMYGKHKKVTCPHCNMMLSKKNFKTHCKRKHTHHFETVLKDRFLASQCVDVKNGVFGVEKSFCGPASEDSVEDSYPPDDRSVARMLNYLLTNKKLPADLPQALMEQSREGRAKDSFPKHLIPKETKCVECEYTMYEQQLITSKAKILTSTGVVEGISTYRKSCLNCGMIYRYQEWEDGVHNFDDHIILSLHLCLMVRNALQTHTAISKVIEIIETTENVSFPNKERVLQAYLHFEALTNHNYSYNCVSCGYSPAVVVMDLHKKGVFNLPVSEIQSLPDDYDGHVDIANFWDAVAVEMISRGLIPCGRKNPFVVPPSYHHWAPWIGPHTRRSNSVLNTEFEKMQAPKTPNSRDDDDEMINEERLTDELVNLKVEEIRALCKNCGVDDKGSKVDLVMRLWEKMSNRVTYNKVFEKVWAASGGWAVITCPCGVVYSLKFNLRAESPRDFVDLLLSWKDFPNVSVYGYARGLALHANRRQPGIFAPFQGRLLDPTPDNIKHASESKVHVNLPWLKNSKMPADENGHPLTGSSQHFALNDVFHQGNSKDQREVLRKLELVPELAGLINSQCVEQLFSGMRKNNYFLNMTTPSTQIFLQRNILHHYNMAKNKRVREQYSKIVPSDVEMQWDIHGRLVLAGMPTGSSDNSEDQEECQEYFRHS